MAVLPLANVTVLPVAGAAFESPTVQFVLPFTVKAVAPHCSAEIFGGVVSENATRCDELPIEAVRFAV